MVCMKLVTCNSNRVMSILSEPDLREMHLLKEQM